MTSDFLKKHFKVLLLLGFFVFLSYANSLGNAFISDDIAGIPNNPNIKNVSYIFSNPTGVSRSLVFYLAYQMGGPNPLVFRLFNILFHLGNVWLIYYLVFFLSKRKDVALFTSALFAVHPILTESVIWISGGAYSEYTLFILLSIIFYLLANKSLRFYIFSLVSFFFAITTSEKAIVLPFILGLYELGLGDVRKNWKTIVPYFVLAICVALLFVGLQLGSRLEYLDSSFGSIANFRNPLVQIPVSVSTYLLTIFWPANLSFFYGLFRFDLLQYFAHLSVFLIFLAFIVISWKKNKLLFFWLTFFLVTLIPTLIPLTIIPSVQERYVYPGTIGIFFGFSYLLTKEFKNKHQKYIVTILFTIIIVSLLVRTNLRNNDWKNSESFWVSTVKTAPRNPVARLNLANVYYLQGNFKSAEHELKLAISVNPHFVNTYHALGILYRKLERDDLALTMFQKSVTLNPNLWQGHNNIGSIYIDQKNYAKAIEEFNTVLKLKPDDKVAREWINKISNSQFSNSK